MPPIEEVVTTVARSTPKVPELAEPRLAVVEPRQTPVVVSSPDHDFLTRLTAWCAGQGLTPPEDVIGCLEKVKVFFAQDLAGGTNTLLRQKLAAISAELESHLAEFETARESGTTATAVARSDALGGVVV